MRKSTIIHDKVTNTDLGKATDPATLDGIWDKSAKQKRNLELLRKKKLKEDFVNSLYDSLLEDIIFSFKKFIIDIAKKCNVEINRTKKNKETKSNNKQ